MTNSEKGLEILRRTDEGYNIAPHELKLIDNAMQGYIGEAGQQQLDELYTSITNGSYTYPWHMGVEHMTLAHSGDVSFKGQLVDHFNPMTAYSLAVKADVIKLQQYCLFLESKGETIELWPWTACDWKYQGKYAEEFSRSKKAELDHYGESGWAILFSRASINNGMADQVFFLQGHPNIHDIRASAEFEDMLNSGAIDADSTIQMSTYTYGNGQRWCHADPKELALISLCFDYLKDNELLDFISEDSYAPLREEDELEP